MGSPLKSPHENCTGRGEYQYSLMVTNIATSISYRSRTRQIFDQRSLEPPDTPPPRLGSSICSSQEFVPGVSAVWAKILFIG
jgi:hypothetical protein